MKRQVMHTAHLSHNPPPSRIQNSTCTRMCCFAQVCAKFQVLPCGLHAENTHKHTHTVCTNPFPFAHLQCRHREGEPALLWYGAQGDPFAQVPQQHSAVLGAAHQCTILMRNCEVGHCRHVANQCGLVLQLPRGAHNGRGAREAGSPLHFPHRHLAVIQATRDQQGAIARQAGTGHGPTVQAFEGAHNLLGGGHQRGKGRESEDTGVERVRGSTLTQAQHNAQQGKAIVDSHPPQSR